MTAARARAKQAEKTVGDLAAALAAEQAATAARHTAFAAAREYWTTVELRELVDDNLAAGIADEPSTGARRVPAKNVASPPTR